MKTLPRLLIVDDDEDILSLLTDFLQNRGHTVAVARDAAGAYAVMQKEAIDLVVLDVMLQGEDGLSICQQLRSSSRVPIIMLTAMGDHADRIVGLELGADDYMTKPFDARELLARVKSVLRRSAEMAGMPSTESRPVLCFSGWRLDVARRELRSADNTLVLLSGGEFDLLLAFTEHPQRVLTRDQLLDFARGLSYAVYDRSIDVQVSRLRSKLEDDPKNPSIIRTVRNGGYIFTPAVSRQ